MKYNGKLKKIHKTKCSDEEEYLLTKIVERRWLVKIFIEGVERNAWQQC